MSSGRALRAFILTLVAASTLFVAVLGQVSCVSVPRVLGAHERLQMTESVAMVVPPGWAGTLYLGSRSATEPRMQVEIESVDSPVRGSAIVDGFAQKEAAASHLRLGLGGRALVRLQTKGTAVVAQVERTPARPSDAPFLLIKARVERAGTAVNLSVALEDYPRGLAQESADVEIVRAVLVILGLHGSAK